MAYLWSGLFPSNNLLPDDSFANPLTQKCSYFPPKFKIQTSTATPHCKHITLFVRNNPRYTSVAFAIPENPNHLPDQTSVPTSIEIETSDFPSQLNVLTTNRHWPYDCKQLHGQFVKLGALKSDYLIGNKLAILYLKSGVSLVDARQLFDEIPQRTLQLYATLIRSYCQSEEWKEFFSVLGFMVHDGMLPDKYVVPTILKACSAVRLLRYGKMVHGFVIRKELGTDNFVGNALIDLYANCGDLRYSQSVFDVMQERDVVSWTALVSAYVDEGLLCEAEQLFRSMQLSGVKPDLISWNALVSGSARIGEIDLACHFMEEMQEEGLNPKVTTWNGLISGCVHSGYFEDALDVFCKMLWFPENPNVVTIVSILPACASLKALRVGKVIQGYAIKSELYRNIHVEGSLIDMYSKCGRNDDMEKVFVHAKNKNTTLWNEMISAYVNQGKLEAALSLLKSMQNDGLYPDEITYNALLTGLARKGNEKETYSLMTEMMWRDLKLSIVTFNVLISGFQQCGLSHEALKVFRMMQTHWSYFAAKEISYKPTRPNPVTITGALAACADLNLLCQGREIHGYFLKNDFEDNIFVSSALVDMYAKCHDFGSAAKVFWKIEFRNTVAWNSFIMAHKNNFQRYEALKLFSEMLCEGIKPSSVTFMIVLPACGGIAAFSLGRQLHGFLVKTQLLELENSLVSALVDMYARCNCISSAKLVFNSEAEKDVASWNAMISANSAHGVTKSPITLFEKNETMWNGHTSLANNRRTSCKIPCRARTK